MKILKITDNTKFSNPELFRANYPNIYDKVVNNSVSHLSKTGNLVFITDFFDNNVNIDRKQRIFTKRDDEIWSTNLIGFISVENEIVEISSRFSNLKENYFFHYLVEKTLKINITNQLIDFDSQEIMYNFLELVFPKSLNKAISRGVYKEYKRAHYNDLHVKGNIDIREHIKLNVPFTGKIAYTNREYSLDNPVTQLIRHTIEYLKFKSNYLNRDPQYNEDINRIIEVTPSYNYFDLQKIISVNMTNDLKNEYYSEYINLKKICLMILLSEEHGMNSQDGVINAILFDMSWLWEAYVYSLISDGFIHPDNNTGYLRQYLFMNEASTPEPKPFQSIFPDYIGIEQYSKVIADAKYKPEQNIESRDYHQILSYMFRFKRDLGLFLNPKSSDYGSSKENNLFLLDGVEQEVNGVKIQVRASDPVINIRNLSFDVPNRGFSSYEEFSCLMLLEEEIFLSKIKNLL